MWGMGVTMVVLCFPLLAKGKKKNQSHQKHPIRMKTKPFENKWSQGKDRK